LTLLLAFLVMLLLVGAMTIGVAFGRKPITGSCGGMQALGLEMGCEICGGDPDRCESAQLAELPAGTVKPLPLGNRSSFN